jgi:hypothetical protein
MQLVPAHRACYETHGSLTNMNLVRFALVMLLCIRAALGHAATLSDEDQKAILTVVNVVRQASLREDIEAIADVTFEPLMELFGGRESFINAGKQSLAIGKSLGITLISSTPPEPGELLDAGEYYACVVREVYVLRIEDMTIRDTGFSIAVRKKGLSGWSLIGGAGLRKAPQVLNQLLPDFPSTYVLPKNVQERLQ